IRWMFDGLLQRIIAIMRNIDRISFIHQRPAEHLAAVAVVFYQQYMRLHFRNSSFAQAIRSLCLFNRARYPCVAPCGISTVYCMSFPGVPSAIGPKQANERIPREVARRVYMACLPSYVYLNVSSCLSHGHVAY